MLRTQQREQRACVGGVIYIAFRIKSCILSLQTKMLSGLVCWLGSLAPFELHQEQAAG